MGDPDNGVGFIYSALCQVALPHRRIADEKAWEIKSDHTSILVEPGRLTRDFGEALHVGVPYGSRARLIMLYMQSKAILTQNREMELGRSMREWMSRMGVPPGGKSIAAIKDQCRRISTCRISFQIRSSSGGVRTHGLDYHRIIDTALFIEEADDERQSSLFAERACVRLSIEFFEELQKHAVPLEEAAIRAINNNSMALDLYAWLSFRLHVLKGATQVSWSSLKIQFGAGFSTLFHFKPVFLANLSLAMAVYPEAKVEETDRGLTLMPSPPPVRPKMIAAR